MGGRILRCFTAVTANPFATTQNLEHLGQRQPHLEKHESS
jgi:hypothetical protein